MRRGKSDTPVGLPVRSLETLERDGRRVRTLRVFCPRHHASIDVSACTACPFACMVSETAVMCAPPGIFEEAEPAPDQPLFLGPDARALRTPLGAICAPHSVAVRVDMPIVQARLLLARETIVVVLTYDDEVRGILSAALPHPPSALDELDECADAIPESAPLVEAIELMVHRHVRLVPLIGDGRRFAGLVSDLDVLRWATRQHNRSESSAARARDVLSKRVPAKEPTS